MLLHHHHVLDQDFPFVRHYPQHAPLFSLVAAAQHFHCVVAPNVYSFVYCRCRYHFPDSPFKFLGSYRTSGAKDTIFRNFFSRSSLATGPKTRVPTGSPVSLISTAAFESNRMYVPSRRPYSLRVRTITALTTVPFLTCPSGDASFTLAVITSPRLACIPVDPPSGMIICSLR